MHATNCGRAGASRCAVRVRLPHRLARPGLLSLSYFLLSATYPPRVLLAPRRPSQWSLAALAAFAAELRAGAGGGGVRGGASAAEAGLLLHSLVDIWGLLRQAEAGSLTTCLLPAPPPHAWCMAVAWRTARTPG